jgi:hypothetical protein
MQLGTMSQTNLDAKRSSGLLLVRFPSVIGQSALRSCYFAWMNGREKPKFIVTKRFVFPELEGFTWCRGYFAYILHTGLLLPIYG